MYVNRRGWFLTAISLATAGVLIAAPAVWADDDKKGGDDHDKAKVENENAEHAAPPVVKVEKENEAAEHAAAPAVVKVENENEVEVENEAAENALPAAASAVRAANLVAAFANQTNVLNALTAMTTSTHVDEDENEVEVENEAIDEFQAVNLSSLTAGLAAADMTSVTNAANADAAAAQAFLNGTSTAGMTLKARLTAAGFNPANVLAILARGEHLDHVTVVLNA
jgi:hypothetical protein